MPPTGARAAHRQRAGAVLDLLASGRSVRDAAAELGVTPARAAKLAGEAIAALPGQSLEDLRVVTELRLDKLGATYAALLDSEDERTRLAAAQGLRQVEVDRVRLYGSAQRPPKDDD